MTDEVKKAFLHHVLGPRGGLFALGVFVGMFIMHVYMTETVINDLKERVVKLEQVNEKLQGIAFGKLQDK